MEIIKTNYLTKIQFQQINLLWNEEYPEKLNGRFGILLEGAKSYNHYLMNDENGNIIGWAVEFEKNNEVRFSIIVKRKYQGKKLGSALIKSLKEDLLEFYGWVVDHNNYKLANGEIYQSPLGFYVKNGFEVLHDQRSENEILNLVKIRWKSRNF